MTDIKLKAFGYSIYKYIESHPECTRSDINFAFKTTDLKRQEDVTWVIRCLVTRGAVLKHLDEESSSVYFWLPSFKTSLRKADYVSSLPPKGAFDFTQNPQESDSNKVSIVQDDSGVSLETTSCEVTDTSGLRKDFSKLKAGLKEVYKLFLENSDRLLSKRDSIFDQVSLDKSVIARHLGRLASLGFVRRAHDSRTHTTVFYTLTGVFPDFLIEKPIDVTPHNKSTEKKFLSLSASNQNIDVSVNTEEPNFDEAQVSEIEPRAYLSDDGEVMLLSETGDTITFTLKENAALRRLFCLINTSHLKEIL